MRSTILLLTTIVFTSFAGHLINPESAALAALTHIETCPDFHNGSFGYTIDRHTPIIDRTNSETIGYIFDLSPIGYIITSTNSYIRPIIAYSASNDFVLENTPENFPLAILQHDLQTRTAALPYMKESVLERNNSLWWEYTNRAQRLFSMHPMDLNLGPYLDTEWNQGDPYNTFCPIDPMTMFRCPIGCVVTAMGQIINYWEWPPSVTFDTTDSYESTATTPSIFIDALTANIDTIDWNAVGFDPDVTTMALFLYACGVSIHMQYSDEGSAASSGEVVTALLDEWDYFMASHIFPSSPGFYSEIAFDIISGRVSYLSLDDGEVGHAIVIDGYRETGDYHVNYGWGGAADGWYFLPDSLPYGFTTANSAIVGIQPPVITHRPAMDLEAQTLNGGYILLNWSEPTLITEDVLYYNVYHRLTDGGSDVFLTSTSDYSYIDTAFTELTLYTYSVGAVYDECGESRLTEVDQYSGIYNGWTRYSADGCAFSAVPLGDGGFVAAGTFVNPYFDWGTAEIVAKDLEGNTLWHNTYGDSIHMGAHSIAKMPSGDFIIAGYAEAPVDSNLDIWLLCLDADGESLWAATYGTFEDDSAVSVIIDDAGNIVILALSGDDELSYIVKTDASGSIIWQQSYGPNLVGAEIISVATGGYAFCGMMPSGPAGMSDAFVMKIGNSGDSLWAKSYGGFSIEEAHDILETASGDFVVIGKTRSFGMPLYTTTYCIKTDADGDTIFTKHSGDMRNHNLNSICEHGDGYVAVGFVENTSTSTDLLVQYLDENLDTVRTHVYSTIGSEEGYSVVQLSDSGIGIAAISYLWGGEDFWLIKVGGDLYEPVAESEIPTPDYFELSVFPNPFNSVVTIHAPAYAEIEIFDILGRKISVLRNTRKSPDVAAFEWSPDAGTASGVYFIRAVGEGEVRSARMVYLK